MMTNSRARGRAVGREGARRNVRPDAPNTNYTIKHNICIITMLCNVCSTLIAVKSTLDDPINVSFNFSKFFSQDVIETSGSPFFFFLFF